MFKSLIASALVIIGGPGAAPGQSVEQRLQKSRTVPLSERASSMLSKLGPSQTGFVSHHPDGTPLSGTVLDQQHARLRRTLKVPEDFVLHSLRHTFGTRLGEAGADAFTIMRLMGHSTVTVSQRYVHPSPEAVELAYERMTSESEKSRYSFRYTR